MKQFAFEVECLQGGHDGEMAWEPEQWFNGFPQCVPEQPHHQTYGSDDCEEAIRVAVALCVVPLSEEEHETRLFRIVEVTTQTVHALVCNKRVYRQVSK